MTIQEQQVYDSNLLKIAELKPDCQWAARQWMNSCFGEGKPFRITEAFRSQDRQDDLILQGRWTAKDFWDDVKAKRMTTSTAQRGIDLLQRRRGGRPGGKVTYTLDSNHTKRIAADVVPLIGGYSDEAAYRRIAIVAAMFGITHPLEFDTPHFEFDRARREPIYSPAALLRRAARLVANAPAGAKAMLARRFQRAQERVSDQ